MHILHASTLHSAVLFPRMGNPVGPHVHVHVHAAMFLF